jgi:SPP1 gp7 family putative phage head morphogenesis protein
MYGEQNALDGRWIKELENASAKVHISRLDALKLQTRQQLEQLYGSRVEDTKELLGGVYTESLYKNGYESFIRTGVEAHFDKIDTHKLNQVLSTPWTKDGANFSDRIWKNKAQLISTLNTEFTKAIAMGEAPDKLIKNISQKLGSDMNNTKRLVMTESAYFATKGQRDCYNLLDVEEYEILGTLDSITCDECGGYDGKHFKREDMQVGVNAPPFHPNCRCTTIPYFDDEFTEGEERAARNLETGKTEYVESMTYEEWKEKFVGGENSEGEKTSRRDDVISKSAAFAVKSNMLNSRDFTEKFKQISEDADERREILSACKKMLKHRSGTNGEDLYYYNTETKRWYSSDEGTKPSRPAYNDDILKGLSESAPNTIMAFHNHPESMPPSMGDIRTASQNRYKIGYAICHNGKIFEYTGCDYDISDYTFNIRVEKLKRLGYNEYEAQLNTMQELAKEYGFHFREVK